jgi:hypothetical protein
MLAIHPALVVHNRLCGRLFCQIEWQRQTMLVLLCPRFIKRALISGIHNKIGNASQGFERPERLLQEES